MQRKLVLACTGLAGLLFAALLIRPGSTASLVPQAHAAIAPAPGLALVDILPANIPQDNVVLSAVGAAAGAAGQEPAALRSQEPARASLDLPAADSTAGRQRAQMRAEAQAAAARPAGAGEALPAINGYTTGEIVLLPAGAAEHVRQIFARGRELGRDEHAFAKVGDSTMAYPALLGDFADRQGYNLGPYDRLQATIDFLAGSFARHSAAVKKGMHTWSEFDPEWVAVEGCRPSEGPLACELRLSNASIALIRLGANDATMPTEYEQNLRKILDYCLANGVVPILGTKPDRSEGLENTINGIVHRLAAEYGIPLWDYDLVASTVPGKGLAPDQIHFTPGDTHDFSSARAFQEADPLQDLTALLALDTVRAVIAGR